MPRTTREQQQPSSDTNLKSLQHHQSNNHGQEHDDDDGQHHVEIIDAPFHQVTPALQVKNPNCTRQLALMMQHFSSDSQSQPVDDYDDDLQVDAAAAAGGNNNNNSRRSILNAPRKPLRTLYQKRANSVEQQPPPMRRLDFVASDHLQSSPRLLFSNRIFNVNFPAPLHKNEQSSILRRNEENTCPRCEMLSSSCVCSTQQLQIFSQRKFTLHLNQVLLEKKQKQQKQNNDDDDDDSHEEPEVLWSDVRKSIAQRCDAHPDMLLLLFAGAPVWDDEGVDQVFNSLLKHELSNQDPPTETSILSLQLDVFIVPSRFSARVVGGGSGGVANNSCCEQNFGLVREIMSHHKQQ